MTALKQRTIDLLAMGRVANLPTVVSNVFLGCLLALGLHRGLPELRLLIPCLAGCLLYLGGCFLNDWKDTSWDAEHKPDRPLPSMRLPPSAILALACLLLLGGLVLAVTIGPAPAVVAALLILSVVLYTWIHKRTTWAILPMGLCRALLYALGFTAQLFHPGDPNVIVVSGIPPAYYAMDTLFAAAKLILPALGILSYIAGISLLARFEARGNLPHTNKVAALCLLLLPALTHSSLQVLSTPLVAFGALLPFVVCVACASRRIKTSISAGVSLLLAGIALLDLIALVPIAYSAQLSHQTDMNGGIFSEALNPIWVFPLVSLGAFLFALLLQRIAPAT